MAARKDPRITAFRSLIGRRGRIIASAVKLALMLLVRSGPRRLHPSQLSQMPHTSTAGGVAVRPVRTQRVRPLHAAEASTLQSGPCEVGVGQVATL
jgi:hypothetical protein